MATITVTAGFRWWFHPALYAVCLIAAVTRMTDARFERIVTPLANRAVWLK